jgi:hypothetical protein
MEGAMKAFEKSGQVSRQTKDGSYRVSLSRQPERESEGQYLFQVFRLPRKETPKAERMEKEELALRYNSLQRALLVLNQALEGGLDTLLLFHKPPSASS